jgi:hypothetical protein
MTKTKSTKEQRSAKHTHKTKDQVTRTPLKTNTQIKKMWFAIFYTWHLVFDVKTCVAGTAYPSGAPEFTPGF